MEIIMFAISVLVACASLFSLGVLTQRNAESLEKVKAEQEAKKELALNKIDEKYLVPLRVEENSRVEKKMLEIDDESKNNLSKLENQKPQDYDRPREDYGHIIESATKKTLLGKKTTAFKKYESDMEDAKAKYELELENYNDSVLDFDRKKDLLKNKFNEQKRILEGSILTDEQILETIDSESLNNDKNRVNGLYGTFAKINEDGSYNVCLLSDLKNDLGRIQTTTDEISTYSKNNIEKFVDKTLDELNKVKYHLIEKMDNFDYFSENLDEDERMDYISDLKEISESCALKYNELNKSYGEVINTLNKRVGEEKAVFDSMRNVLGVPDKKVAEPYKGADNS